MNSFISRFYSLGFLLLALPGFLTGCRSSPPSDATYKALFAEKKADFIALHDLFLREPLITEVAGSGVGVVNSNPPSHLDPAIEKECMRLFSNIGQPQMKVRKYGDGSLAFWISSAGVLNKGYSKGVTFESVAPRVTEVVDSLESLPPKTHLYKHLEGNWYIELDN